jgi:hypothetical protein
LLNRGEQTLRAVTGSGGRNQVGTVADIKSESRPDCVGIRRNEARAYADEDEPPESMMRRHLVRGHFKVGKSGVYWWRPFLRGSYSWASSLGDSAGTVRGQTRDARGDSTGTIQCVTS